MKNSCLLKAKLVTDLHATKYFIPLWSKLTPQITLSCTICPVFSQKLIIVEMQLMPL